jgi:hypothetical protein
LQPWHWVEKLQCMAEAYWLCSEEIMLPHVTWLEIKYYLLHHMLAKATSPI